MANIWDHPDVIAQEALTHLEDALVIAPLCAVDTTSDFTTKSNGWKVGDTVSFRTHGEYAVTEFSTAIAPQPITSSSRPMKIEKHYDISVQITSRETALELDSLSEQVIRPAMYSLAEKADAYFGTKILEAAGLYVSDTLLATAADIALARKAAILQQLSTDRFCLVDLNLEATLLGQTWFNQSQTRGADGERTLREGDMGRVMGMDWFKSLAFPTNSATHTPGDMVCVTNNDTATKNIIGDTSLIVDGQTASKSLAVGDRLQIAGVRRPLKVKTIIADTSSATEVELVDPIAEVIPDNAAVTVIGAGQALTYKGAIFDSRTLAVAFPMLDKPGDRIAATASNNGISVRIVKGYDMSTKVDTLSIDFIVGAFMMDPRRATLLAEY